MALGTSKASMRQGLHFSHFFFRKIPLTVFHFTAGKFSGFIFSKFSAVKKLVQSTDTCG